MNKRSYAIGRSSSGVASHNQASISRRNFCALAADSFAALAFDYAGASENMESASRTGGCARAGLDRAADAMRSTIDSSMVPGMVTLLARQDEVHVKAIGLQDTATEAPMRRDTIFRIASMTKPVSAAAAMILVEEGMIGLDDPVDRWLPELANAKVLRTIESPLDDTVSSKRPVSLRDLQTMRLGFGAVMAPLDTYPVQNPIADLDLAPSGNLFPHSPDEFMQRLGSLPLLHQPGERWMYHTGSDVLGVLIARVSGQSLEQFLSERIFAPLGMNDTSFWVPEAKLDRLATCYQIDLDTGQLVVWDKARGGKWSRPPTFEAGGGGLVSTVDDYLAFCRMMLNGGRYGSERILTRASVEAMTSDQITPAQKAASPFFPGFWDNQGWGFGLSVTTEPDDISSTPGRYGWAGGYGTTFIADPNSGLVAILLMQRLATGPDDFEINQQFLKLAYHALEDTRCP